MKEPKGTTKREFLRRAMEMRPTAREWRRYIDKAMTSGCLKPFAQMNDDYSDVYPLAGAILEDIASNCISGSTNAETRRRMRREANNIRSFI